MKTVRWCWTILVLGLVATGMVVSAGWAQIPTLEERIRDSGRNPENCTWRAHWIRIWPVPKREKGDPPLVACYRYDFTLSAQPREAAMTFSTFVSSGHWVIVNDQVVAEPLPGRSGIRRTLDLTKFLRAGHNVLAFKGKTISSMGLYLAAEGIVFGQDGSMVRLLTDKTWKGGWDLAEGWEKMATDPKTLPTAQDLGLVRWDTRGEVNPPYYGPIQVAAKGMSQPIFDAEKPIELNIDLLNMGGAGKPEPALMYEIMDEFSRKTIGQGQVALSRKGDLDWAGSLRHTPLAAGAYRFRFTLIAGGEEIDRRDYEVASIGEIKQRLVEGQSYEEGMDLKLIWQVDCTQEPKPGEFIACSNWESKQDIATRVEEGPAGRYRTLVDSGVTSYFAYRFKVERLFVPHLAVIEWPDDAPRQFQVRIWEGTSMFAAAYFWKIGGLTRGDAAVMCIDEYPRTNKMQKMHIIYWPNEEEEAIHFFQIGGKAPPAASKISVYEITNDLPALKIADAGDRMIGYHTERGPVTMSQTFYSGPQGAWFPFYWAGVDHPEFYRDWYTTTENFIKRMRFSGQNMYLMGHFMYTGVLYPSKRYIFAQNSYPYGDANRDYCGLVLRMFGRNGMNLISGIEYGITPDLVLASPATADEIRQGAPTLFAVGKNGGLGRLHASFGLNYFHPQVQEALLTIVDELIELYKDYPAWKGIGFLLSRNFGPMAICRQDPKDDPLNWGYEDYTIELFQKETGIKIPVGAKDPERFAKRYDWLMAHAKQRWIDWRCQQFTKLYRKMRDRLIKGRPDLKLYLLNFEPMHFTKSIGDLSGLLDDQATMIETLKTFGFDVQALKKDRGMVVTYSYSSPGTRHTEAGIRSPYGKTYRDLSHSETWHNLIANDGKGGAYIWSGFTEFGLKIPKGKWLFERACTLCAYPWPPGPYINDTFVNVLVRSNPTLMPHTWIDSNDPSGHLQEMRLFARAYRSLPNGKYRRLTGQGRDLNIWIEECQARGARYAYAANTNWWEAEVTLTFAPGAKVRDLIRDLPVKLENNQWKFRLGPYAVQTFRVEGNSGGDSVKAASAKLTSDPSPEITAAAERAETALAWAKENPEVAPTEEQKTARRILVQGLERIAERRKKGDLSGAYQIATSWQFNRAPRLVTAAIIPWAIIGPFDNKERVGLDQSYGPETDYLAGKPFRARYQTLSGDSAWQEKRGNIDGFLDLNPLFTPNEHVVAYAATEVNSPVEQPVLFHLGSDDGFKLWVNGKLVGECRAQRGANPDQNRVNASLVQGWNRILLKVDDIIGNWAFFLTITDPQEKVIGVLRFRTPEIR